MRQPWVPATLRRKGDALFVAELPARVSAVNPTKRQAAPGERRQGEPGACNRNTKSRRLHDTMKQVGFLGACHDQGYAPFHMEKPADITLKDVISHMQGMEQRLTKRIDDVDARLTRQIDRVERNLTGQIDAIDQRLDALEIERLPKRMKKLERAIGIA